MKNRVFLIASLCLSGCSSTTPAPTQTVPPEPLAKAQQYNVPPVSIEETIEWPFQCDTKKVGVSFRKNLQIVAKSEFLNSSKKLAPSGITNCTVDLNYSNQKVNEALRFETGNLNGAEYRIWYSDGSGYVRHPASTGSKNEWSTRCTIDKFNDSHMCMISRGVFSLRIRPDGSRAITIGREHFPGSQISLRVDKNAPISASEETSFSDHQVEEIIKQLQSGSSFVTRYEEWPYQAYIVDTFDLLAFSEALEILQKLQTQNH